MQVADQRRAAASATEVPAPDRVESPILTMTDTGTGMAPDTQDHIFDPFFTTKDTEHGTGPGLATVHGIVHQAGGSIKVESQWGAGSTFRVRLPLV